MHLKFKFGFFNFILLMPNKNKSMESVRILIIKQLMSLLLFSEINLIIIAKIILDCKIRLLPIIISLTFFLMI